MQRLTISPDGLTGKAILQKIDPDRLRHQRKMSKKITRFPLDFGAKQSVCGAERTATMDAETLETTLKVHISEMRDRLEEAAGIAKAAVILWAALMVFV